ncbi:MAG: DUF3109 family protein [Ignavibacteria bacterium]|nr:DUF3109 family protein [Ignavibacteria bacterium]
MKVDNIEIDETIFTTEFCCDINKCRGACCTISGTLGAPTDMEEICIIEKLIPEIRVYMETEKINEIMSKGFYENYNNKYYLNTLNGNDCIFVFKENGIAKCAIEKAFLEGKIEFRKPVSCELFPIRYNRGTNYLKYEKITECESALEKGKLKGITVAEFAGNAIKRKFGKEFYYKIIKLWKNGTNNKQ